MSTTGSAKLLAVGAAWRLTGAGPAGRRLVRAARGGGETERSLAGMMLVQAGDRSVPVLVEAIMAGSGSAALVTVLASIGTDGARNALARVCRTGPPCAAAAAAEALRTLEEIRNHREDS
ncbi:MAG TPA: hypothetical protein VNA11_13445 [Pseudonocardia sp.]|nr:hypothetical protein [Pseudonocardia sp.]